MRMTLFTMCCWKRSTFQHFSQVRSSCRSFYADKNVYSSHRSLLHYMSMGETWWRAECTKWIGKKDCRPPCFVSDDDGLTCIAHFTNVSMRFTTSGGLFWAAHYGALAAKQLTIMRNWFVHYASNWNRLLNRETIPRFVLLDSADEKIGIWTGHERIKWEVNK
jgi:hypothetical protein